jgi:hypothetical protein
MTHVPKDESGEDQSGNKSSDNSYRKICRLLVLSILALSRIVTVSFSSTALVAVALVEAGIAYALWIFADYWWQHGFSIIGDLFCYPALCCVLLTITHGAVKAFSNRKKLMGFFYFSICAAVLTVFVCIGIAAQKRIREQRRSPAPIVLPSHIQLHTGKAAVINVVSIRNPTDADMYDVELQIILDKPGVPIESLSIVADVEHEIEAPMLKSFVLYGTQDGRGRAIVDFTVIPAHQERRLVISGTVPTNNFADLSIVWFTNSLKIISIPITNSAGGFPKHLNIGPFVP